jgi:hypothetical protein
MYQAFIMAGIGGHMSVIEQYAEAQQAKLMAEGKRLQGEMQRKNLEWNARVSDLAVEDAYSRGEKEASQAYGKGQKVRAAQRAATAASGIEVGTGSAAQLEAETSLLSEMDMIQIRSNAWQEAWGHKLTASEYRFQGRLAQLAAESEAMGYDAKSNITLLTSGMAFLKGTMSGFGSAGGIPGGGGGGGMTVPTYSPVSSSPPNYGPKATGATY